MNREELAWAAGLFDGEGSTGSYANNYRDRSKKYRTVRLSISQNDREVLKRFCAAVGVGKVLGPHPVRGYGVRYQYLVASFEGVQAVVAMLWAWLSKIKRDQAKAALTNYLEACTKGTVTERMTRASRMKYGNP